MDPMTMMALFQMMKGMGGGGGSGMSQAPAYAGGGMVPTSNFGSQGGMPWGGISQLLGGLFGNSESPFQAGMDEYEKYNKQAREAQNPFYDAGKAAIPKYQDWLSKMEDPTKFMNGITSQYDSSPYAKFQQEQSNRAATNMGSATGLTDSTPLTQFAQQNSRDISSQDQNQWLQNVLGINNQYGAGQKGMVDMGQHSADMISQLFQQLGMNMGQGAYGKAAGRNQDMSNIIGGMTDIGSMFF